MQCAIPSILVTAHYRRQLLGTGHRVASTAGPSGSSQQTSGFREQRPPPDAQPPRQSATFQGMSRQLVNLTQRQVCSLRNHAELTMQKLPAGLTNTQLSDGNAMAFKADILACLQGDDINM